MSDTPTEATQETATPGTDEATVLPDDHPLVKSLAAQKVEIKALKEKTARLGQLEDAQKSAEQKAAEREAAAESRAVAAEARALRREVALDHKLDTDDAALLDSIVDEDAMRSLAARLAKQSDTKPKSNHVPREGMNQTSPSDDRLAFLHRLTGRE